LLCPGGKKEEMRKRDNDRKIERIKKKRFGATAITRIEAVVMAVTVTMCSSVLEIFYLSTFPLAL
jgi:hypothetical protein